MKTLVALVALLATQVIAQKCTRTRTVRSTITRTRTVASTSTALETSTAIATSTLLLTSTVPVTSTSVITSTAVETETDTVTNTATSTSVITRTVTTTTTAPSSTATAFNGRGYLYVYPNDSARRGCLISGGNWYNGGGTCATYTATPLDAAASAFTLSTSRGPCVVAASDDTQFRCGDNTEATVFGQRGGNLTYSGSTVFYAAALATGNTQQPVFAADAPGLDVTLDIKWFGL